MRLSLIVIARIEADTISRPQFSVIDVTYVKAAAGITGKRNVPVAKLDPGRR
jgi:hypothetical protein